VAAFLDQDYELYETFMERQKTYEALGSSTPVYVAAIEKSQEHEASISKEPVYETVLIRTPETGAIH
jgi:hypothetical protein